VLLDLAQFSGTVTGRNPQLTTLPTHARLHTQASPPLHGSLTLQVPPLTLPAGVLRSASPSVVALLIPDGAHHVDLMYSHEGDTDAIRAARVLELKYIQAWLAGYWGRREEGVEGAGQQQQDVLLAGRVS
jgi:hypothetical protein